jgi:hypothetical protein
MVLAELRRPGGCGGAVPAIGVASREAISLRIGVWANLCIGAEVFLLSNFTGASAHR